MKNKVKLLSVILTLAMAVSLIPAVTLPAFAEEPEPTPFYIGNAMRYADANDALSTSYLTSQVDNITMEAWVKADTLSTGNPNIRIMYNGDSGSRGYGIYLTGANKSPSILMGKVDFLYTTATLNTSQWYHLAAVRDTGVWKFYVNGKEYPLTSNTLVPYAPEYGDTFTVGNSTYANENFTGSIDEVRFWTVARTADEIKNSMYVKLNGNETGLLAYYNFDQEGITPGGNNTTVATVTDMAAAGGNQDLGISGFALTGDTSNFVQSVKLGTLQLGSTAYSVSETAGSVTIPIVRTGGSEGSVTINYVTADGTAAAGTNYTSTSGSVAFAEGETSKSISVPVLNQSMSDSKTFNFSIWGQDGVSIGANSSAAVTITPCCAAPTVTATGGTVVFPQGGASGVDLFSSVTAATNDYGQTFSGATLTVTNVSNTTEYLTLGGTDIALADSASGTFTGGSYGVSVSGTTATVTLSGMVLDNTAMGTLIDDITYKNSAALVTAGNRVITLTSVTDSGGSNNSAAPAITATVNVVNYAPADGATLDISSCTSGNVILIGAGRTVTLDGNSVSLTNISISCETGSTLTLRNVVISNNIYCAACPLTITGTGCRLITESGTTSELTGVASFPGISVAASAVLTLNNDGTLTTTGGKACAGLQCPDGAALTVSGKGTLNAAGTGGAGIGGGYQQKSGTMTFLSGTVNATVLQYSPNKGSYCFGAGIGGGAGAACGSITISGGSITATGGSSLNIYGYTGIGGADITITGGTVTAKGCSNGAGIGGGSNSGSTITITGGTVIATGGTYSMGIGSGKSATPSAATKVTIEGGTVYATGGFYGGAGIGGSNSGSGGEIEISGGTVYAEEGGVNGGYYPKDIGPGARGADGTLTISGTAQVFLKNNSCTMPPTTTHTNSTWAASTTAVYGTAISVPVTWTTDFYAYLHPCTLSYDANGGSGAYDSVTQLYNTDVTLASGSDLSLDNYHFDGWNTAANGSGNSYAAGGIYTIEADTTFYAQWSVNTYTVTYDPNGGTVSTTLQVKQYGSTYGKASDGTTAAAMPTPTWAGHTFSGWFTAASGGTKVTDSDTVGITENTTLYAQWTTDTSGGSAYTPTRTITVTETSSDLFSNSDGQIKAEANMTGAFSNSIEVKVTDTEQTASDFGLVTGSRVYPFDISLYIKGTNNKTEPKDGYAVTISLPVPNELLDVKEQLSVIHKSDGGSVTTLEAQLKQINGVWYLVFDATEFSPYALVVNNVSTYNEAAGLPYYVDSDGNEVFLGFAANGKYIATSGVTVLFKDNAKTFADTDSHWAKDYIGFVAERELFNGTGDNKFSPDMGMTRAVFATVIGRLYERSYGEIEASSTHAFTDCDYSAYYGRYVDWAAENSILGGYGNGTFGPDDPVTREQMAAILYRFADFLGVLPGDMDTALNYPDASTISSWAQNAALYCQSTGIITGRDGGIFAAETTATRAEVAVILQRFVETVV